MITHLHLINFRSYAKASFEFSPGVNYIHGNNGVGKSNLLEAISLLICGRSFRAKRFQELILEGQNHFYLEVHFIKAQVNQVLKMHFDGSKKRVFLNETPLKTLSALFGILRGSFLLPEDENLIKGCPEGRRIFLDSHLGQLFPHYLHHLTRYAQALKERNALLREKKSHLLWTFEEQLAISAAEITTFRRKLVHALERHICPIYENLSAKKERVSLHYKTQSEAHLNLQELKLAYCKLYEKERKKELDIGYSLVGPHRDDLEISLNQRGARAFASEGQKRLCATALRLAEWHHLKENSDELPLMCIDDVAIALDKERTERLFDYLARLYPTQSGQLFVTTTLEPANFTNSALTMKARSVLLLQKSESPHAHQSPLATSSVH